MFPASFRSVIDRCASMSGRLAVGIDMGRDTLRVVALRQRRGKVRVLGLASRPAGEPDRLPATLRAAVETACRRAAWRPRRVVAAMSAGAVLVRSLEVDALASSEEIAEAVERSARALSLPLAALRLVWAVAPGSATEGFGSRSGPAGVAGHAATANDEGVEIAGDDARLASRQIVMVAARRDAVMARQAALRTSGIGRVRLDVEAFAAWRSVVRDIESEADRGIDAGPDVDPGHGLPGPVSRGAAVLVDAGSDSLRAMAWSPGGAAILRVAPLPREVTAPDHGDAAHHGGLDRDPHSGPAADAGLLANAVTRLLGEVAAAPMRLGRVILAGGRAATPGLAEAVAVRSGLPVMLADPFLRMPAEAGCEPLPSGPAAAAWATAHGLALRGLA